MQWFFNECKRRATVMEETATQTQQHISVKVMHSGNIVIFASGPLIVWHELMLVRYKEESKFHSCLDVYIKVLRDCNSTASTHFHLCENSCCPRHKICKNRTLDVVVGVTALRGDHEGWDGCVDCDEAPGVRFHSSFINIETKGEPG